MTDAMLRTGSRTAGHCRVRGWSGLMLAAVWAVVTASGCSITKDDSESAALGLQSEDLGSENGLSANGLSANGLSANGLSANGLSANGLSAQSFATWFAANPALADMVMRYVVRCAVPAEQTRSYADPQTGVSYTWSGGLGLAPDWAGGAPANTVEQQVITACLLAHVNRYGLTIPISVLGRDAGGAVIPYTSQELGKFNVREACFFGNLFTNEGLFFGVDRTIKSHKTYLTRACAGLSSMEQCSPLTFVGACTDQCSPEPSMPAYSQCTRNGVSYRAITTRMQQSDYTQLYPEEN
ncbi:MAG: hypothetical protein ACJ8AT_04225 [Hyalangium sp.]|uniref:hypothetical protein n=1 Tax=Hyalangium sp. TaxID=2028555 RepID=UPI00389983EA